MNQILPIFLLFLSILPHSNSHTHRCIHEHLNIDLANRHTRHPQKYQTNQKTSRRRLAKASLRIHVEFSAALQTGSTESDTNIKNWMNQAANFYQEALKVESVDTLRFDLFCNSKFPVGDTWSDGTSGVGEGQQCASYPPTGTRKCAAASGGAGTKAADGESCTTCSGCTSDNCDTGTGKCVAASGGTKAADGESCTTNCECTSDNCDVAQPTCNKITIPSTWYNEGKYCSSCPTNKASCTGCTTIAAGNGIPNKDYVILVEAVDTTECKASVDANGNQLTLGYAAPCKYDQFDRPILGSLNFCPLAIASASSDVALATAKHELAHALGFTAGTIPYFRDPLSENSAPRTTRGADGKPAEQANTCADGNTVTLATPASTTLNGPTAIRGFANAYTLITPNVAKAAKEHYNCPSTIGIELENQPTGAASSCWGSHWEQRVLNTELMTPVVDQNSVVSQFTLGYFEDTGWYEAGKIFFNCDV